MSVFSFAAYYTKQLLFAPYPCKCRDVICQTTILPHIRRIEPLERPAVFGGGKGEHGRIAIRLGHVDQRHGEPVRSVEEISGLYDLLQQFASDLSTEYAFELGPELVARLAERIGRHLAFEGVRLLTFGKPCALC